MEKPKKEMLISRVWLQAAVVTFLVGFGVLGYLAYSIYAERPPVPKRVVTPEGTVLFTAGDIIGGQHVFQKFGLMQFGTIFGHGAYLGPDFTAESLHLAGLEMLAFYRGRGLSGAEAEARVRQELKENRYDSASGDLRFGPGQAEAYSRLVEHYRGWFGPADEQQGLRRPHIKDPESIRKLTAYFSWAAWTTAATRPGKAYSYTNNWPPDQAAGNSMTGEALIWSVLSLIALMGGSGLLLFAAGRYQWLGWEASPATSLEKRAFRETGSVKLTPAQRMTAWYFLVVALLFLGQGTLGGINAHYHAEPASFYNLPIDSFLPYNLSRTWHLQLALFFVSASYLAMGIFLAPMIAGQEPKHQEKLAIALFAALVVVVVGSLAGEAASIHDLLGMDAPWFWIGDQGWEFLDLGRLWQFLLTAGMVFWVVILVRGLAGRVRNEHPGNMPWLFLYSALTIPLFYAVGMVFGKGSDFALVDFWRFWVVHLWVEDFLELFTTIMVAYLFVLLGVVRPKTAMTVIYLDVILYSIGGVIGTMHHLYFSGSPAQHMALGAFFSAMEVIPLLFLTYEAWRFMQLGAPAGRRTMLGTTSAEFPHKWAVMFLIAVGFWNFLGAGIFGFLINLPVVSYFEIGTQFTANHGHGALMGVYGMLAMAFFMFATRYFVPHDRAADRAMAVSFWSLNAGLLWMLFVNLFPVGYLQLVDSVNNSYWHARSPEFFSQPAVRVLEWLRLPGDILFIVGGILPVVYLAIRMFLNRNRAHEVPTGAAVASFTERRPGR